ncbi:hypothetical protein DE146DRAFT_653952 [Phaeosphaeria sp. MPI-PUGE-AT-0046c]|nr:hypothetical protein DE146DRAFT_653952 [Phaeosphaeria sp. MPI-PUGE-AT-0046c]
MDEPARKRRKTSSPTEGPSSPLRKPPRRPSFASPTKASLARNYPNLLPSRPTTSGTTSRPNSRGDIFARGKQARAYIFGETDVQEQLSQEATRNDESVVEESSVQHMTPRARKPRRPQSGAIEGDTIAEDEEQDLPTTPSQRGLEEQDGPRRGILYSSPSKRPPRMKGPIKQSPLRPKAPPVQQVTPSQEDGPEEIDTEEATAKKQPPNPELEKRKQERARLEREVKELEAQVSRCAEEIVKEQQRSQDEALRASDRASLQEFIAKVSGANDQVEEAMPVSRLLCSFLPFSTVTIPQRRNKTSEKPIASHQPIELADPLPYLEMFTSLKFTTHLSLPRGKISSSSQRVYQKHTINIISPQRLLAVQISLVIDALANEIIDMQILSLSPWAERELGAFLRRRGEEKDLGNACWAIGSYWNIAQKRAQHWQRCEATFPHLSADQTNDNSENVRPRGKADAKISRRDLNRHLGRDSFVLQDRHVILKLNWRIGFDWTGEAESEVNLEPAFPSAWTEDDVGKTFSKVPETFSSLLQSRGVYEATRVMTALLFAQ